MFLSFSLLSLFVDLLTSPLISNPGHSVTDNPSLRFNVKIFQKVRFWLGEGARIFSFLFFFWCPNPFSEPLPTFVTSPCFESLYTFVFLTKRHQLLLLLLGHELLQRCNCNCIHYNYVNCVIYFLSVFVLCSIMFFNCFVQVCQLNNWPLDP